MLLLVSIDTVVYHVLITHRSENQSFFVPEKKEKKGQQAGSNQQRQSKNAKPNQGKIVGSHH